MDHTQAYFHWFAKTHAHVHLCRCQPACIEQSEKTVCPCEDEGRSMQRKDGGSNAALPDSKSCANGWRRRARGSKDCQGFVKDLWEQATNPNPNPGGRGRSAVGRSAAGQRLVGSWSARLVGGRAAAVVGGRSATSWQPVGGQLAVATGVTR